MLDTHARLPSASRLVRSAGDAPVLVATGAEAAADDVARLTGAGCEVVRCPGDDHRARLDFLLAELGRRRMTNVLVEGGGEVLGSLLDLDQIDEVHVFIAPNCLAARRPPVRWPVWDALAIEDRAELEEVRVETIGQDVYLTRRVRRSEPRPRKHAATAANENGPVESGPIEASCLAGVGSGGRSPIRRNRRSSCRSSPCRAIWLSSRVRVLA